VFRDKCHYFNFFFCFKEFGIRTTKCNARLKVDSRIEVYLDLFERRLFDDEEIYAV
jgi:hypothetical protein